MSNGSVFTLIANDGKADKMLMATEFLSKRLLDIMCTRAKNGYDPTPTLADIERTHILFVNAHFKPFAAIGFEYNKVRVNSGSLSFGGNAQWSIPQFGDFFSDCVVNAVLGTVSATVGTVPAFPSFIGSNGSASSTASVSDTPNATSGVYTKYTYEYVDSAGDVLTVGNAASNFVRYVEYPGQRFPASVRFEVNGNPLDSYDPNVAVFHQKFKLQPNKVVGWKRLMGQEVPLEAHSDLMAITGTSPYGAAADLVSTVTNDVAVGVATSALTTARKLVSVVNGPQTPKATQPALELWIPLLFWFCKDPRLAIASVSIPYGQRFINMDIETQANLVQVAPGDLFLRTTVSTTTSAGTGKGTAAAQAVTSVSRWITLTPTLATGSVVNTTQAITTLDLYINNIFVNPEIHDIYIKRIGFSLIRVHRIQVNRVSNATDSILMSQMKWPIETMFLGMRPAYNVSTSNPNMHRDWHRMTATVENSMTVDAYAATEVMTADDVAFNASNAAHKYNFVKTQAERLNYFTEVPTVNTIEVVVHGITLYTQNKSVFYNAYLPYTYGGANIMTPEDPGALMLNFCMHPGTYQPSGHINLSRAREFYVNYTSSYIDNNNPADLINVATALNFLLTADGSCVLRYNT